MEPQDPRIGSLVDGRYRLLRRLGAGGAGTVYLARHEDMDRLVAVKLLHGELPAHSSAFVRFRREARAAGSLKHPGVVTIHDFGRTPAGEAFLVMELCEGASLSERLGREGPLAPREALRVLGETAAAVDAAHAAGMVHRDLKPANILFAEGRVRVADFGLARVFDEQDGQLTGAHAIGSPPYMSPEQCQGLPATAASDVYSLGVVAFELLTGRLPFTGGSVQAVLVAHVAEEPPSPAEWLPDFPPAGEAVLRTALAKEPFARWGSAGAFHAALVEALDGGDGLATTTSELRAPAIGRATGAAGARERSGAPSAPPIGRDAELARLLALAEDAAGGAGHLVTVAGETGSGKSTLLAAFLGRARARWPGSWIALGRASERFAAAEPYAPFLDALGELLRGPARPRLAAALASIAPTWAAHLPGLAAGGGAREELLEGRRSRDRMPREFAALVDELAARQPLALAFEDLHWADATSVDLLAWIAPRLERSPVLIVGTYRPAEVEIERHPLRGLLGTLARGGLPWTEIAPAAFGRDEIVAFLARELDQEPPDDLVDFVHRRSEGNPLFLVNVLNHLFQCGAIERGAGGVVFARPLSSVERSLPEGIVAVIRQKVERLGEEDRRLLEAASVEGEAFSAVLVARLVEQDEVEVEERLREIGQRHRLIEPAGELEFPDGAASSRFRYVHSLYQNAFYEALAPKRRERLHARAGEELERLHAARPQGALGPMAVHFEKGREFQRAVEKTLAAADLAAWRNPKDARPHLEKAIELAARLPEADSRRLRAGLLVRLARHDAESAEFTGDTALYERAEEAISEALLLEPGSLDARTTLGLVHLERGENERAFADFARVLERESGQAAAWDGLSYLFKNTGFWRAALAAQQRAASRDPAYAHSIRRLSVLIYLDRSDEAEAEAEALVARRPFFAHYNYWRGIAAWYAGERRRARQWIEQGHSLDPGDPIAQGVLAFALAAEGEAGAARELLATAEPGAAADGTFTYWIAKVHALLGEGAEAVRWIRRAAGLGYWDSPWMRKDPAIRALDAEPDFPGVLAELDARRAGLERFARANARPDLLAALELPGS